MLGHLMEWFYSGLAGIRPADDAIAFNKIEIRPEVVGDVAWAKANYQSPYGTISSSWKKEAGKFELSVTIPANTTATICLPVNKTATITSGGQNIKDRKDMKFIGYKNGKALVSVGSGSYLFVAR
jgi:hypothetical protein